MHRASSIEHRASSIEHRATRAIPIATQKNRPRLDEARAVWTEEGFRHVCSVIFQGRKTNTCVRKLAVKGFYSWPKTSRRIHSIATDRQIAGRWYGDRRDWNEKMCWNIQSAARHVSEVLNDPEPAALFRGFGDSSLDFQLRAWTRGDYVSVSSDLLVGVNNALTDAGIEIPFPQRDLHLRSVDTDAAERILSGRPKNREIAPE